MPAHHQQLDRLVTSLGYADSPGYVDESGAQLGARDFVWRDLRRKCRVDSAFFSGAVPLVAFVDAESTAAASEAHRRLWNFGRVPVLIASTPQEVFALSCSVPPMPNGDITSPLLQSARPDQPLNEVLREFSRFSVESGNVTTAHAAMFRRRDRVDRSLLENLRALRRRLSDSGLTSRQTERLLGRSIFIRYLEDRKILSAAHMSELVPFPSFVATLRAGPKAVRQLFAGLGNHFNGDVFATEELDFELPGDALLQLADFFSGTQLRSGQQVLWPYDFSVIPTELISSIYEQLLEDTQRQDAAYYTPRHVVDLVLDELLAWDTGPEHLTILDPACGSGIFLTEAFKRLVYRHSIGQGRPQSFAALVELLTSTIHGVDRSEAAIGVTAFGLYLALLEHVDPPAAWREARLPGLVGRNLIASDFFDPHALSNGVFDIVLGNPPWQSSLTDAAARYVDSAGVTVPDKQIALAFVWRSIEQTRDDGAIGLVLPAKPLLHNRSGPAAAAREEIFSGIFVETLVDLSPLRNDLFGASTSPAVVAIARRRPRQQDSDDTLYVVPRRTPLADAIDGVVVPQDSITPISRGLAIASSDVWKTHLWGSASDHLLVTRLREKYPSLATFADERRWVTGAGFQIKGGDRNDARALVGLPLIDTTWVRPMRLAMGPPQVVTESVMHRPRDAQIYRAPHVLMRNGFKAYPMSAYADIDAAFAAGLFGLAGPPGDAGVLRVVSGLMNSSLARYWYFMTASSWGVEREKLELHEYLSLPIPPLSERLSEQIAACVISAAEGSQSDSGIFEMLDELVYSAYELTAAEQDLVEDGLHYRLDEFQRGARSQSYDPPTDDFLGRYVNLLAELLQTFQSVAWKVAVGERSSGYVIVTCTARGDEPTYGAARLSVESLLTSPVAPLESWNSPAVILQPSAFVVDGLQVHVIKPDQARSWTRSMARTDAGDVIGAVLMAPRAERSDR
jgi:hypothetical protein